jgi:hypothetical protein
LEPLNPGLDEDVLRCNALTLMTLVEGLHVVLGCSKEFLGRFNNFEEIIKAQARQIAANTGPA